MYGSSSTSSAKQKLKCGFRPARPPNFFQRFLSPSLESGPTAGSSPDLALTTGWLRLPMCSTQASFFDSSWISLHWYLANKQTHLLITKTKKLTWFRIIIWFTRITQFSTLLKTLSLTEHLMDYLLLTHLWNVLTISGLSFYQSWCPLEQSEHPTLITKCWPTRCWVTLYCCEFKRPPFHNPNDLGNFIQLGIWGLEQEVNQSDVTLNCGFKVTFHYIN